MKSVTTLVIVAVIAIIAFMGCNGYNGLVKQDEVVVKAWNNVEAEYQNRLDLVDNLVATVKGAADFEKSTLEEVVNARAKASSVQVDANNLTPEKIQEFQAAQSQLSGSLSRLLVTVEAYPNLKATEGFMKLQSQLEGIENNIKNAKKTYNEAVQVYNTKVRSFPMNILAGMFGFDKKTGFQAEEGAERAPKVDFSK